ncbi:MAG: hypothetical protein KJO24_06120, partial [Gammaproteobacteria bacterium]|nr:hypothetical protein [Gammaproteobacteria bacterium]
MLSRVFSQALSTALLCSILVACGGGGGGGSAAPEIELQASIAVSGGAVKGPWANAAVAAYQVDPNASDLKGALLDQGQT